MTKPTLCFFVQLKSRQCSMASAQTNLNKKIEALHSARLDRTQNRKNKFYSLTVQLSITCVISAIVCNAVRLLKKQSEEFVLYNNIGKER